MVEPSLSVGRDKPHVITIPIHGDDPSPQTHVDRVASFCPLPIMSADTVRITTGQFTFRCVFRRLEILTACLWPRQSPRLWPSEVPGGSTTRSQGGGVVPD